MQFYCQGKARLSRTECHLHFYLSVKNSPDTNEVHGSMFSGILYFNLVRVFFPSSLESTSPSGSCTRAVISTLTLLHPETKRDSLVQSWFSMKYPRISKQKKSCIFASNFCIALFYFAFHME